MASEDLPTYELDDYCRDRGNIGLVDTGEEIWCALDCKDGSVAIWLSKHYRIEDITTNATILDALHKHPDGQMNTKKKGPMGQLVVHVKPDVEYVSSDAKEPRLVAAWVIQAYGVDMDEPCTNCAEGKGIFVDCRTLKGLADGACGNCKKRDHNARCSLSNAFKAAKKAREKAFGKPKDQPAEASTA